ncbi:hypothetical protein [Microbacterium sp.]|uniref:hypothetical protein n=1 Tax=Microbacterium sp. TaxID=51671 RepID=UPI003A88FCAC
MTVTASPPPATRLRAAGRGWSTAAAVALLLKTPLVVIGVTHPNGVAGVVPPTEIGPGLWVSLTFLASSVVFILGRHWFGAVSTIAYCTYTAVGAVLMAAQFPLWAGAILVTSPAALAFTITALTRREFSAR